jgi:hypothetical protein
MTRDAWCLAFVAELERLRPYLQTGGSGPSRVAWSLALTLYRPDADPSAAARQWHTKNPAAKKR